MRRSQDKMQIYEVRDPRDYLIKNNDDGRIDISDYYKVI